MQRTHITLCTREQFPAKTLVKLLEAVGREYIIQGQTACLFSEHPKQKSLDYWLRTNSQFPDKKLADNQVMEQFQETGLFEISSVLVCPDSGKPCKGLILRKSVKPTTDPMNTQVTNSVQEKPTRKKLKVHVANSAQFVNPSEPKVAARLASLLAEELRPLTATIGNNYNYTVGDQAKEKLHTLLDQANNLDTPPDPDISGGTPSEWNLNLRKLLKGRLAGDDGEGDLNDELCVWVVRYWGGTDRNDKLTKELREIILNRRDRWKTRQAGETPKMGFDRISSWSKILALMFPNECAIYDSRTAFALNWLQFQINVNQNNPKKYLYWPVPPGMNTMLGLMNPDQLLVTYHIENLSDLVAHEQENVFGNTNGAKKSRLANRLKESIQVKKSLAYGAYCELLRKLGEQLFSDDDDDSLLRTEMLLFAAATQDLPSKVFAYLQPLVTNGPFEETAN